MNCKIVSDSSSNVYTMSGVPYASVPLKIYAGNQEFADTPELDIPEMVAHLQGIKTRSSTSCPNAFDWVQAFGNADVVLGVSITSNLSGSYAAAQQAIRDYSEMHPNARVYIHDSLSAGPELTLMLEKMQSILLADVDFDACVAEIRRYSRHTHLVFSLESLTNLANNGRVSPVAAKLAGMLGIRIVGKASDIGTLEQLHKCRGEKKALSTIQNEMQKHGFNGGKVRIAHCQNLLAAEALRSSLLEEWPGSDIVIDTNKGLCSYYAEQGGLLVGYEDSEA